MDRAVRSIQDVLEFKPYDALKGELGEGSNRETGNREQLGDVTSMNE